MAIKWSFLNTWRTWWRPAQVLVLPGDSPQAHVSDLPVPPSDAALLAWRDWCATHAGQRCKVAMSSRWVMTGVVTDSQAANANAAASEMARQWDHYMNIGATALARDWWVRTTRAPGGWLVCATPKQLVDDIMSLAKAHHIRVVWMGPWWTAGLQRWLKQAGKHPVQHLQMLEPDWCLHVQTNCVANRTTLQRLWAEPVSVQPATTGGSRVVLTRNGAAATSCVWDDAATQALMSGQSNQWREAAL